MKGWMEVFRAGEHISANGTKRQWTPAELQHMAESYDPAKHEAPVVIGHPKTNAPAWGWVKQLQVVGDRLMALPGQLAPEFTEWLKAGRYKKRSISIYPDGTLRHVGFLGAQPPAVKGLKDIDFAEGAEETYEYAATEDATMTELEKLQQQLAEEKEKNKVLTGKTSKIEADYAELQAKTRRQQIADFVEQGIKEAKILPAWKQQGIEEFMNTLDGQTETYEFSEGKKERPLDWFKGFISSFGEHPLFKAMVKPEDDKQKTSDFAEEDKLGAEIAAKVNPVKA